MLSCALCVLIAGKWCLQWSSQKEETPQHDFQSHHLIAPLAAVHTECQPPWCLHKSFFSGLFFFSFCCPPRRMLWYFDFSDALSFIWKTRKDCVLPIRTETFATNSFVNDTTCATRRLIHHAKNALANQVPLSKKKPRTQRIGYAGGVKKVFKISEMHWKEKKKIDYSQGERELIDYCSIGMI
jgi:hypothetical protein